MLRETGNDHVHIFVVRDALAKRLCRLVICDQYTLSRMIGDVWARRRAKIVIWRLFEDAAEGTPMLDANGKVVPAGVLRGLKATCAGMRNSPVGAPAACILPVNHGHIRLNPGTHPAACPWLQHRAEAADAIAPAERP